MGRITELIEQQQRESCTEDRRDRLMHIFVRNPATRGSAEKTPWGPRDGVTASNYSTCLRPASPFMVSRL
jgi:hypothetical protein